MANPTPIPHSEFRIPHSKAPIPTRPFPSESPYIKDLVARKLAGPENVAAGQLRESELAFHEAECERLRSVLQSAYDASQLPELPSEATRAALEDLLVRIRLKGR